MGRTMGDHDEAIYRQQLGGDLYALERAAISVNTRAAWAELDAERAHSAKLAERVAELEQMYAEMKDAADKGSKSVFALAAEQAENARLREALDRLRDLAEIGLPMKATLVHAITHDVLAQSPSSNAALREVCRRVAMKGLKSGRVVMDDGTYVPLEDQAAQIVDAILGPEVTR